MPEPATPPPTSTPPATDPPAAQPPATPPVDPPKDDTDWKAEARKWEQRAKENRTAAQELEKQRLESMSEAERAIAEAEAKGRASATTEFGQQLARSEYVAAAARRNPGFDAAGVLDDLNLSRFLGDDGKPDVAAIAASVERLVPASGTPAPPSFDGGPRGEVAPTAGPAADFAKFLATQMGQPAP